MPAELIDGRAVAGEIERSVRSGVDDFRSTHGVPPSLTVIVVGEDPRSLSYIRQKTRVCARTGIRGNTLSLPADTAESDLLNAVRSVNEDDSVHALLIQEPLPDHIRSVNVLQAVDPLKDVDGFHPENVGLSVIGAPRHESCTPLGIMEALHRIGRPPNGKHAVIVGRSGLVGKPLMNMLLQKTKRANATVTLCHTGTPDLSVHTRQADILIAAAGRPEFIAGDMIKPGAVVIDVGINAVEDPSAKRGYRLVGDVHFESAKEVAGAITPVPGGVGPLTCVMLASNTLNAARLAAGDSG